MSLNKKLFFQNITCIIHKRLISHLKKKYRKQNFFIVMRLISGLCIQCVSEWSLSLIQHRVIGTAKERTSDGSDAFCESNARKLTTPNAARRRSHALATPLPPAAKQLKSRRIASHANITQFITSIGSIMLLIGTRIEILIFKNLLNYNQIN